MQVQPEVLYIILAILGAVVGAVIGFLESDAPVEVKEIIIVVSKAAVAGLIASFAFQGVVPIFPWTYVAAFLAGMGVDVGGKVTSTVGKRLGLIQP